MLLIVGLGNPGPRYKKTRHNVGFLVLDELHKRLSRYNISQWSLSKKFNAEVAGTTIHGEKVILAKPMTFMNASGQAVGLLARYYNITAEQLIVVHDEKDLPLGEYKIQQSRGHAGHNGVKSLFDHVKTDAFVRIRVGIGTAKMNKQETADFVLGKFGLFEKKPLQQMIDAVVLDILGRLENAS